MQRISYLCKTYRFEFLYAFLAILVAFSPYIREDLIIGADSPFHLARIETLAQNLSYGIFPTKVHVDLCYGYGYGVGFFYPDFFLYIPAVLMLLGLSLEVSFKLFAGMLLCGIFLSIFYCVYRLTSDRYASLTASALFLFSTQVMGSFYYTFSLGVSLGLIFFPLAICGMYLFLTREEKPYMLGIGFAGLLYSHMLSTFLAVIICSVLLLIYFKKLIRAPRLIAQLFAAVIVVSAVTSSFWLPFLEQIASQTFRLSEPWTTVDKNVLLLSRLIHTEGFGWTLTILVLLAGFYMCLHNTPKLRLFYYFGLILYLLPVCGKFWTAFQFAFKFLQFPKRLLVPATILMVFAIGILFADLFPKEHQKRLASVILLAAAFYTGMNYIGGSFEATEDFGGRVLYQEIAGLGSGEEYLPIETTREDLTTPITAFSNIGDEISGIRQNEVFSFTASSEAAYYDVPFIWYKGYTAYTENGTRLQTTKDPEHGMVRVLTNGLEGSETVNVRYTGTPILYISYGITFLAFLGLFLVGIIRLIHMKKKLPN